MGYENSKGIIEFSTDIGNNFSNFPVIYPPLVILSTVPGYIVGTTIFIASGITGFIMGIGKSVPETYNEIKKIGETNGLVIGKFLFEYDGQNRIIKYDQYSPLPDNVKLSETSFFYHGNSDTPYKTINYSFVEKKNRVIYPQ